MEREDSFFFHLISDVESSDRQCGWWVAGAMSARNVLCDCELSVCKLCISVCVMCRYSVVLTFALTIV